MPTQQPRYNFGTEIKNANPTLYNQLNDTYESTARVLNTKPSVYVTNSDPTGTSDLNKQFSIGDFWINQSSDTAWIMTSRSSTNTVTWKQIT